MKPPISREELKRRMMQCGGISPDDAENAAVMELFDEIDRLRGESIIQQPQLDTILSALRGAQQTPPQGKTVDVRVAVAVDREGDWAASGWTGANKEMAEEDAALYFEKDVIHKTTYWLTANLPVPQEVEVVAEVEDATR